MIEFAFKLGLVFTVAGAAAESSRARVKGKVKSFDAKTVHVVSDGHELVFDVARVVDKSKLRQGQTVQIDLDREAR